ncbi:MAG TPA: hypothetical protein VFS43_15810 [Polyangiaceae bacterium]|nr:hypothetical protein [Polyangiaceae bacterium]
MRWRNETAAISAASMRSSWRGGKGPRRSESTPPPTRSVVRFKSDDRQVCAAAAAMSTQAATMSATFGSAASASRLRRVEIKMPNRSTAMIAVGP